MWSAHQWLTLLEKPFPSVTNYPQINVQLFVKVPEDIKRLRISRRNISILRIENSVGGLTKAGGVLVASIPLPTAMLKSAPAASRVEVMP